MSAPELEDDIAYRVRLKSGCNEPKPCRVCARIDAARGWRLDQIGEEMGGNHKARAKLAEHEP